MKTIAAPGQIVSLIKQLAQQADRSRGCVRLNSDEELFQEHGLHELSLEETLEIERSDEFSSRVVSFLPGGLIVHPTRAIEKSLRRIGEGFYLKLGTRK